jgi:hypothetical protein
LGARDVSGVIGRVDDDSSPLGDGRASGLTGVSVNSETLQFSVSGFGDSVEDGEFSGGHFEQGEYEVFVHVFDSMGAEISMFSQLSQLSAGLVEDFEFSNPAWMGGSYNVYIDNTVGSSDVDFYTFAGLTPNASFEVRMFDEFESGIATYLGWFDDEGELIATDADSGDNGLSFIMGTVPSSGSLTFAVTGIGDDSFAGDHSWPGAYTLVLEATDATMQGDLNQDNYVDAADYVMWRKNEGSSAEYELWTTNFGRITEPAEWLATETEALTVAEPAACILLFIIIALQVGCDRRSRRLDS